MDKHHHHYIKLLSLLKHTHQQVGKWISTIKSEEYGKELRQLCEVDKIESVPEHTDIDPTKPMRSKIKQLSGQELGVRIKERREKLKSMEMYTEGKQSTSYLSSLYILMYLLKNQEKKKYPEKKEKRDYRGVISEGKQYLIIRAGCPEVENINITIRVIDMLLKVFRHKKEQPAMGYWLLSFISKHLAAFLRPQIDRNWELQLIHTCLQECFRLKLTMAAKPLFNKLIKSRIKCQILQYEHYYMKMLWIYMYGWLLCQKSTKDQYLGWLKSTQEHVYDQEKQAYEKEHWERNFPELTRFPDSIKQIDYKHWFNCFFEGVELSHHMKLIRECKQIQNHWEKETPSIFEERQQENLRHHIMKYIDIYHLNYRRSKKYSGNIPREQQERLDKAVRKVWGEGRIEMQPWQYPLEHWNRQYAFYAISYYIAKCDVVMVAEYLRNSNPHYVKIFSTATKLHHGKEGFSQLPALLQSVLASQDIGRQSDAQSVLRKVRNRCGHNLQQERRKKENLKLKLKNKLTELKGGIQQKGLKNNAKVIEQFRRGEEIGEKRNSQKLWREAEQQMKNYTQIYLFQKANIQETFPNSRKTRPLIIQVLCKSSWRLFYRFISLQWGPELRSLYRIAQTPFIQFYLRSFPPPHSELSTESSQRLGDLIKQKFDEIDSFILDKQHHVPILKILLIKQQVPKAVMQALFFNRSSCTRILKKILNSEQLRKQLLNTLKEYDPNQELAGLIGEKQVSQLAYYLHFYLEVDEDFDRQAKEKRNCIRYVVLNTLVKNSKLHDQLRQVLQPMMEREKIKEEKHLLKHDSEKKLQVMKDGHQHFIQAATESNSYLRSQWGTPQWWPLPKWPLPTP